VTPEGKHHSSQNALRHGLLARRVVLDDESREGFETLLAQHVDRLQPADEVELAAIRQMVAASWRLRRAWATETRLLNDHLAENPKGDLIGRLAAAVRVLAASGALGLVHRYEARMQGIYQRTLRDLLLIRAAERAGAKRTQQATENTRRRHRNLVGQVGNLQPIVNRLGPDLPDGPRANAGRSPRGQP
jgi:hypothetical protein